MADHRVTDLSYGQVGRSIYDESIWNFSVHTEQTLHIRLLENPKECLSFSSAVEELSEEQVPSVLAQNQMRWLSKSHPEILPGIDDVSSLLKSSSLDSAFAIHEGCLLTVTHAKDKDRISGQRRPLILAFPSGESNHVLHLIRPKPKTQGWTIQKNDKLKMLDPGALEYGYWTGTGGAIRQIASATDEEGRSDSWLAVRQDTLITIFQPEYRKQPGYVLSTSHNKSHLSLIDPNPVVDLTPDRTSSRVHVDVTFNPFYPRQFAVIDDTGRWSIWDVENRHKSGNSRILQPGRSGAISEDKVELFAPLEKPSKSENTDGWHRVLWACNVNTIVVCSRYQLAVFNVESIPEKLNSPEFLPIKGNDWIIDVVRHPINPEYLYILSTSRIYWIQISPTRESQATKVILSYRHHMDPNDETMRLTTVPEGPVSVAITSAKNPLVNVYSFSADSESACRSSFNLRSPENEDSPDTHFRNVCVLPCSYQSGASNTSNGQNPEIPTFFQLWGLTPKFGIATALGVAGQKESLSIRAPDKKIRHASRSRKGSRTIDDSFVISDEGARSTKQQIPNHNPDAITPTKIQNGLDWSELYKRVFMMNDVEDSQIAQSVSEMLEKVNESILRGIEEDLLPMNTLANIAHLQTSLGELEKSALSISNFLESLSRFEVEDLEATSKFMLSDITQCPGAKDFLAQASTEVDLIKIHEQLVKYWITSLPMQTSNQARLAKFKIIRQLGVELALNLVGISLQYKTCQPDNTSVDQLEEDQLERDNATTRESSLGLFSSQPQSSFGQEIYATLNSASRTPSLYSHATSAASELKEDPAITRLRQYATSIRARPDPGKSSLLAHWPSQPGVDPGTYSYEAMQKRATAEDSGNESEYKNKREEARRRKRTERFLRQGGESMRTSRAASVSQPVAGPSGSQPNVHVNEAPSSQIVDEIPMTQPVGGAHGSRLVVKGKKPKKQRKAGF